MSAGAELKAIGNSKVVPVHAQLEETEPAEHVAWPEHAPQQYSMSVLPQLPNEDPPKAVQSELESTLGTVLPVRDGAPHLESDTLPAATCVPSDK